MGRTDELTGRELRFWPGFRLGGWFFALIGIGLFAGGVLQSNRHLMIAAALPMAIALGIELGRARAVTLILEEEGVSFPDLNQWMDYDDVQSVIVGGVARSASDLKLRGVLVLSTNELRIDVPERGDVPRGELYRELLERIPAATGSQLEGSLQAFQQQETEAFGPQRVFAFRVRERVHAKPRRPDQLVWPLMLLVAIVWVVIGALGREYEAWVAGGVVCGIGALVGWGLSVAGGRVGAPRWKFSLQEGLVVAPTGIALRLGESKGKLRWDELLALKLRSGTRHFALSHGPTGIVLTVKGAEILVPDVFERPLGVIFRQMEHYWRGPE